MTKPSHGSSRGEASEGTRAAVGAPAWMAKRTWVMILVCGSAVVTPVYSKASTGELLDQGYNDMYNLAFDDAHRCFQNWERSHPRDPMGPVSDAAAYLYSEFDRLKILQSEFFVNDNAFFRKRIGNPDPIARRDFEAALERSEGLAEAILKQSPDDETALFATVLRLGLHADYTALIEKRYFASLNEVKQARGRAEQLLAKHPDCYDGYLAIGFENYVLSLKPAPLRWLLRINGAQTDRDTGIAKLRLTAENGHYLKPFAELLLAVAALRDKNEREAKRLLSRLTAQFPGNQLYRDELKKVSLGT
ncbi:MAG: hypothetical protein ACR2IV_01810 [Bryobacteraceae bacterium]